MKELLLSFLIALLSFNVAAQTSNQSKPIGRTPLISSPDKTKPLSEYAQLKNEREQLLLFLAFAKTVPTPDELMKVPNAETIMFDGLLMESNVFKRQELITKQYATIISELAPYRANPPQYLRIPFRSEGSFVIESYDLDKKIFHIHWGCGQKPLWGIGGRGHYQPISIDANIPCEIKVEDQNIARKIEESRAAGRLQIEGELYVFITGRIPDPIIHDSNSDVIRTILVKRSLKIIELSRTKREVIASFQENF